MQTIGMQSETKFLMGLEVLDSDRGVATVGFG
jgi:hypothetical protein